MDEQKIKTIIDRLIELSKKGELNWKTTGDTDTYLLGLKDSSISISRLFSADLGNAFELQFRNEKGEIAEKALISGNNSYAEKAALLFELARSKALNANGLIDRILEQLSSPDSVTA